LFPSDGVHPLASTSPFINPSVTTDAPDKTNDDNDKIAPFEGISKKDSRMVNNYFSHLFKSAVQPSANEDHRLSMKDGQALESISLQPLEGMKILGGTTKVQQWISLLAALKLHRSQVLSLWADLTYDRS
jgi:hypothetical protein